MATEVVFAKTFLAILDKHPQKITPDHVEDPRNYPATTPYTLPRLTSSKPMSKRSSSSFKPTTSTTTSPSSSQPSLKITVHSPRNPPLALTLPTPYPMSTTSMLDIKSAITSETCLPTDKLKLLYNKKPVADTKTLKDVLASSDTDLSQESIEFSLMVMGGAATAKVAEEALAARRSAEGKKEDADGDTVMEAAVPAPVVAEGSGLAGRAVLETEEFWADLKGFLQQRIRDEKAAGEVCEKFRGAVGK